MTTKRKRKIVKENGKWCVKSKNGKKSLGCYDTEAEAKERLGQVEHFKKNSDELEDRMTTMLKLTEEANRLIIESRELFARLRRD